MPTPSATRTRPSDPDARRTERILILDELAPEAVEAFRDAGFDPETRTGLGEDELVAAVAGAHALVVRSATKITRRVIEAADRLAVVGRAGVGVDNIDVAAATERGVVVMNAPTGNSTTTAELAIALMCALARHVPWADRRARGGNFKKGDLKGTELTGKTLGVVGLGRIGRLVAERGLGLSMRVVAYDPYLKGQKSPVDGVELLDELDDLLARSDFVTLHVPLSDATRDLISAERIAKMKKGARLVNAARGGLVDEDALAVALESGHLRGAALDVFATEPPPADHPLVARDDVVITPHLGASSEEAQRQVALDIARQISAFLAEGVAESAVNAPAVSSRTLAEIAPYVLLAEKLGSFLAQRCGEPIKKLELSLTGEIARFDPEHLRLALLVGVLRHGSEGPINFVNAPALARERGIQVHEWADEEPHFLHSLVKVRAFTRGGEETHVCAGTVYGREPRIVRVDHARLDLPPNGPLLLTEHDDAPGVIGLLGTLLGEHGVNIRRVELGPEVEGRATGFLVLYEPPSPEVIAAIGELAPVRRVQLLQLS